MTLEEELNKLTKENQTLKVHLELAQNMAIRKSRKLDKFKKGFKMLKNKGLLEICQYTKSQSSICFGGNLTKKETKLLKELQEEI